MGNCLGSNRGKNEGDPQTTPKAKNDQSQNPEKKAEKYEKPDVESEEDDDDEVGELMAPGPNTGKVKPKTSVCAEVYGKYNQKGTYEPKVIDKDPEVKSKLLERLNQAFMFSSLEDKEKEIVLNAMEEVKLGTGDEVIKQGDDGNVLFVVYSGKLSCHRVMKPGENPTYLKDYGPGECFGELALLYNCPRAATIRAEEDSVCYSLDRDCFNSIVKESTIKKRERYETFLGKVDLLSGLSAYEKGQVADCLTLEKFKTGDKIITEGEPGQKFYLIESGTAQATKNEDGNEKVVFEHNENDYFGELALLNNEPRKATITCTSDVVVASIDRKAFIRLLGPLTDVMEKNKAKYN